jgi:hypothetical protein
MKGLRLGAVVLLDALGFKGIWNRMDSNDVLRQLKRIKREGLNLQGDDHGGVLMRADAFDHRVKCISDTIIVVVTVRGSSSETFPERPLYGTMLAAVWIASSMVDFALRGFPPFLFRGCMTTGRVSIDGDFLIGPAIDEAAELYERSDGPFLWMAPSALRTNDTYADTFMERIEPNLMIRYPVPMKSGATEQTLAHHHFLRARDDDRPALIRARTISAFGDTEKRPDVARKRANALAFLDHIQQMPPFRDAAFRMPYLEDLTLHQRISIAKREGLDGLLSLAGPELRKKLSPRLLKRRK